MKTDIVTSLSLWQLACLMLRPFPQDLNPEQPVKLAMTCWARASFDVLHYQMGGHPA